MSELKEIIQLEQLQSKLTEDSVFIGCISYEPRSMSVLSILNHNSFERIYTFYGSQFQEAGVGERLEHAKSVFGDRLKEISFSIDAPIEAARMIHSIIKQIIEDGFSSIVIDSTTFTHELLLMIIKVIHSNWESLQSVHVLYVSADEYSVGDRPENKWLSKGCSDVRNVIGYSGKMRPTAKTCLVLLAGFEHERATKLIELLEPERIVLGNGIDSTHDNHDETMKHFREEFEKLFSSLSGKGNKRFNFSCKDVTSTARSIIDIIRNHPSENIIIVPLNTKLSTIATAYVALKYPDVQVAYAIAETYNTENYSRAGENVTIVDMKRLFDAEIE